MLKVLYIAPHLSTGGMPEFLRMRIEQLQKFSNVDTYVLEYSTYSYDYTVQREEIIKLIGSHKFFSLGNFGNDTSLLEEKFEKIKKIVQQYNFDIIHIDEVVEQFDSFNGIDKRLLEFLYSNNRTWKIVETPHSIKFSNSNIKKYIPDGFLYCSDFHLTQELLDLHKQVPYKVAEYPVIDKTQEDLHNPYESEYHSTKNLLNIGLWTPGKNQAEVVRLAKIVQQTHPDQYCFHFIGNQASNFKEYWGPLIEELPSNIKVWGEQKNVEGFIKHCDGVIHTSLLELNPLVLKEARSYGKKIILRYLQVYKHVYDSLALYLTDNDYENSMNIVHYINHGKTSVPTSPTHEGKIFAMEHIEFYKSLKRSYYKETPTINYLVHSTSFGDTLAATPTLRYLSNSHNTKINVVTHCKKAFANNPYVQQLLTFDEYIESPNEITYQSFTSAGTLDGNKIEKKFTHIDIRQIHAMDLGFQLTPDQLHYDFYPDISSLQLELPDHYVVLHVTENWQNRTWAYENWFTLIEWLAENNIFTVLVGKSYTEYLHSSIEDGVLHKKCPTFTNLLGIDLTEQGTISDLWHIINGAEIIVTMDSGPLHLAGTTDTYIIQLGSPVHPTLRAPFRNGRQDYKYSFLGGGCDLFCNSNLKYNVREWGHINAVPPLIGCLESKNTFECHPAVEQVINKVTELLDIPEKQPRFIKDSVNWVNGRIEYNLADGLNVSGKVNVYDKTTGLKAFTVHHSSLEGQGFWISLDIDLHSTFDCILELEVDDKVVDRVSLNRNKTSLNYIKNVPITKDIFVESNVNIDNSYLTYWEIFIDKTYEKHDIKIEPGDVVLDIGGNHGFFALYSLTKLASKVFTVEPSKECFSSIEKISSTFREIIPLNAAVSNTDEPLTLISDPKHSAANHVEGVAFKPVGDFATRYTVPGIHINKLLKDLYKISSIDLAKIDCEGSEEQIFEAVDLSLLSKIPKLIIETHSKDIRDKIKLILSETYTVTTGYGEEISTLYCKVK